MIEGLQSAFTFHSSVAPVRRNSRFVAPVKSVPFQRRILWFQSPSLASRTASIRK